MTLLLSDADVRSVCDIGALVAFMEDSLRKEAKGAGSQVPDRMNLGVGNTFLRVMPAMLPEVGLLGLKAFHGSMQNGVRYLVTVCDLSSGSVLAMVDSAYLTAARTGATSGVATRLMSREDSTSVGLIGSGLEAETNLTAVCAVRPISRAVVYSRSEQRRTEFAARMSGVLGITVEPTSRPQEAVTGADIVVVATNTGIGGDPAYEGRWLEPGQHLVSIGSTTAALREIDVETFRSADTVVFDASLAQLCEESGDVLALVEAEPKWNLGVRLDDVLLGNVSGRTSPEAITVFKSVGSAAQDLIGAACVLRDARDRGVGRDVDDVASPKTF